jgi:hypothetical protein
MIPMIKGRCFDDLPGFEKIRNMFIRSNSKNLPQKEITKLDKKLRNICRAVGYKLKNEEFIYCPLCANNRDIALHTKVNQSKFKFHCYFCDFTFMIIVAEPEIICKNCNGEGRKKTLDKKRKHRCLNSAITCKQCQGNGKLDWVSRVTRAKGTM